MSCQPTPQPQANGTAAIRASMGTTTKVAIRIFSPVPALSGSRSGRGAGRVGASGRSAATGVTAVSVVVIGILASSRALHLTGSYPHNRGQGPMQIRLRNRRLRYRSEEHTSELQSLRHLVCR